MQKLPRTMFSVVYGKDFTMLECYVELVNPERKDFFLRKEISEIQCDIYLTKSDKSTKLTYIPVKPICLGKLLNDANKNIVKWLSC